MVEVVNAAKRGGRDQSCRTGNMAAGCKRCERLGWRPARSRSGRRLLHKPSRKSRCALATVCSTAGRDDVAADRLHATDEMTVFGTCPWKGSPGSMHQPRRKAMAGTDGDVASKPRGPRDGGSRIRRTQLRRPGRVLGGGRWGRRVHFDGRGSRRDGLPRHDGVRAWEQTVRGLSRKRAGSDEPQQSAAHMCGPSLAERSWRGAAPDCSTCLPLLSSGSVVRVHPGAWAGGRF